MEWIGVFRIIYFLGFVNSLFFSFLIFSKKRKSLADKILAYWLIVLSIQLLYPFFYLYDVQNYYQYMGYEASIVCLHPLFLYCYTQAMTNQLVFTRKLLIGLIPLLLFMIATPVLISEMADNMLVYLYSFNMSDYFNASAIALIIVVMVLMSFIFFYFLYHSYKSIRLYKQNVLHIYSYKDNIDLKWLHRLVIFFIVSYLSVSLLVFIFYYAKISLVFIDFTFYSSLVVFVFLLAYYGYQQGHIFHIKTEHIIHNSHLNNNQNGDSRNYIHIARKLEKLMTTEKPYLTPTLTIHDLADKINVPVHQLSKVIHKKFGKNFFEYVNEFRIEYFKKCIKGKEYNNYTILGIALECGFNSKSAFNRIFKEYTGLTPGEYKRTL